MTLQGLGFTQARTMLPVGENAAAPGCLCKIPRAWEASFRRQMGLCGKRNMMVVFAGRQASFPWSLLWSASFQKPVEKLPNLDSRNWGKCNTGKDHFNECHDDAQIYVMRLGAGSDT